MVENMLFNVSVLAKLQNNKYQPQVFYFDPIMNIQTSIIDIATLAQIKKIGVEVLVKPEKWLTLAFSQQADELVF